MLITNSGKLAIGQCLQWQLQRQ